MTKKILAFAAALLMTMSVFTGCGGSEEKPADSAETTINVINNGTEAPSDENAGGAETSFVDPGAHLGGEDSQGGAGDLGNQAEQGDTPQQTAPDVAVTEATLPDNHDDIVNMIQNAETTAPQNTAPIIKEYSVDYKTRYGYQQLNDAEKKLYADILEAAKSVKTSVAIDDSVTDEMWVKVFLCVYTQEPQLFWLSSARVSRGKLWYWEVDKDLISNMQKEVETKAGDVLGKANGKSTYEKLKIFHDHIALNNDFIKDDGFNHTVYGGLVTGQIQCEGYAKTMQYLCDLSGIESMVVVGTDKDSNTHAWNVVKVDGSWYNLDATWNDPILTNVDRTNVRYRYFLVPDEWIHNKSHYNVNKKVTGVQVTLFTPPACTSDASNYFKVTNQLYSDKASADTALRDAMKKAASNKLRAAEIRVASKDVYDAITGDLKEYASWIKSENSAVTSVSSNCDPNTLVIELDLIY